MNMRRYLLLQLCSELNGESCSYDRGYDVGCMSFANLPGSSLIRSFNFFTYVNNVADANIRLILKIKSALTISISIWHWRIKQK